MTLPRRDFLGRALLAPLPAGLLAPAAAAAQSPQSAQAGTPDGGGANERRRAKLPPPSTRQHVLELPGRTLRFTTTAGSVTLTDGKGEPEAEIGYVAYRLDGEAARRPVTFALNGGPGSASAWLHLGVMGPWRLPFDGAAVAPSAPAVVEDNPDTWLDFTDMVFIDPVGTGYSRFLGEGEAVRKRHWSVDGDINAIAQAIRRWLQEAGRMASPKYLVGESYGGFRGPRLVRTLATSHGVGIRGLVLVSPVLDFGGRSQALEPLYWAFVLPTLAAAARNAESRAEVADAEAYAGSDYVVDLLAGNADAAVVERRSRRVAELTGLDPAVVRRHGGRVDGPIFVRNHGPGRLESLYDLSVSMPDPVPTALFDHQPDPITGALVAPLEAAMVDTYTQRLGWRVEAPYALLNNAVARGWEWGDGRTAPEAVSHLRTALALDPHLRVLVVHGLYDVVTPYFRTKLHLDTIEPGAGAARARLVAYPGGHMFYSRDAVRPMFRAEAAKLYA